MRLDDLGARICIMGPSNSGKSTLAVAIARARGMPPVHLDQLHHQPGTDWRPRPHEEFLALHDEAIRAPRWVMDGNYSRCLPQRLERATGVILLDVPTLTSLRRYLQRTWFDRTRHGGLAGCRDRVTWAMIRYIAIVTPQNRRFYAAMTARLMPPTIRLADPRELARFYRDEALAR